MDKRNHLDPFTGVRWFLLVLKAAVVAAAFYRKNYEGF